MARDTTGEMAGGGFYDRHSTAQRSAGSYGFPLLERAVAALPPPDGGAAAPIVIADLGAAGGGNELEPMSRAIAGLRARGYSAPITVVHTDIPTNDFGPLFENLEHNPATYLGQPGVFAFVAGRSFYEQILPPGVVLLGWTAIAVHWLSRVPRPIDGHVYSSFATGASRDALAAQSAEDWRAFLTARATELRAGGQLVVVGGAAEEDGSSGADALMAALDDALGDAVRRGLLTQAEVDAMTIPTWNRTLADFAAPFAAGGAAAELGLTLEEQSLAELPDQYLAAYRASSRSSGDASAFAAATAAFLRAFTEPSLIETLERSAADRSAIADDVYKGVRQRLEADPEAHETRWHVALLRIARP